MPILVIIVMVIAYIIAVALLVAYIAVFVAPRFGTARTDAGLDLERRAREYLLDEDLQGILPRHPDPLDPVCGRKLPVDGLHSCAYRGHVYYFCSGQCRDRFAGQPQTYLDDSGTPRVRPQRPFAHFR